MKRNWLTSVAIVAALVAGSISSNALADNKGMKFSGGGFQVHTGGQNTARTLGNQVQLNQNVVKQINGSLGQYSPGHQPQISLDTSKKLNGAVLGNQIHINPDLSKKLGIGTPNIHPSLDVTKSLNKAILGEKFCKPGCNPGCNPCNKWCGPCWWFCPWYVGSCSPCYPTIYYYPEPIVVEVPVVLTTGVATEVVAEKLMQIPVGATLTLQGKDLGDAAGQVVLQIDKVSLPAQINEWKADAVNVTLPMLGLAGSTKAQLWLVKADGAVASKMAIELIPAQQPQEGAAGQAAQGVAK